MSFHCYKTNSVKLASPHATLSYVSHNVQWTSKFPTVGLISIYKAHNSDRNVGDRAYAMSLAAAVTGTLAAGCGMGIGLQHISLQHVTDDQSAQHDKPRQV